jgi:Zn-dependent peptidase ImmA (M78 family)
MTSPIAEANRITTILNHIEPVRQFPVQIRELALDYSKQRFPNEPISDIKAAKISRFEGMLVRHRTENKWLLAYNDGIPSQGRIRFTIAHELGHYLLHRQQRESFECTLKDMYDWAAAERKIEIEADVFASYLLMPLDDFRAQIGSHSISIDLLLHCADRYGVSPMAAALKWLEIAPKRAVVVAARDGFVLWAKSNEAAFRSGIYLASRKTTIEVPRDSLLNVDESSSSALVAKQKARLWFPREHEDTPLTELIYVSNGDYPYTLGLLLLPEAERRWEGPDDELLPPLSGSLNLDGHT